MRLLMMSILISTTTTFGQLGSDYHQKDTPLGDKAFLGQLTHHPLSPLMDGKRVAEGEKREGVELLLEKNEEQDPAVHQILFFPQLLYLVHFRSIRRTKYLSRMFIHT